jgi:CheY-like chemotaxis protein
MHVDSAVDKGSTFSFTIPFEETHPEFTNVVVEDTSPTPSEQHPSHIVQPRIDQTFCGKILLAEDDPVSRKMVQRMLQKVNCEVLCAVDGNEAVRLFQNHHFEIDLILMDVMMPNLDGLEATARIRELESKRIGNATEGRIPAPIPIIALTAGAMKGDRERSLNTGMTDYITKPISYHCLTQTVRTYLKSLQ